MRTYNLTEVAKLFGINNETVRRWIRSDKLKATMKSKKDGYVIDELDLYEFIQTKPKYRKMMELPHTQIDGAYLTKLNDLLEQLIIERDRLNEQIIKVRSLLEES